MVPASCQQSALLLLHASSVVAHQVSRPLEYNYIKGQQHWPVLIALANRNFVPCMGMQLPRTPLLLQHRTNLQLSHEYQPRSMCMPCSIHATDNNGRLGAPCGSTQATPRCVRFYETIA